MNGPVKLYFTKQIVRHDLLLDLPTCMYKIKNIHGLSNGTVIKTADHVFTSNKDLDISEQVKQFLKNNQVLPEMTMLVQRQKKILEQLNDLKRQMTVLKAELKIPDQKTILPVCEGAAKKNIEVFNLNEILIKANPSFPPYSLCLMQKLSKHCVHLNVSSYVHSTVSNLPEDTKKFIKNVTEFTANDVPKLNIKLIWKEVRTQAQLVILGTSIIGEVNLLRYLARSIPNFVYESKKAFEIDAVLDLCYSIILLKTKTDRSSLLHSLNKKLGKSQWLFGFETISVADIAAYSAIKQVASSEANVNLTKWMQRCENI